MYSKPEKNSLIPVRAVTGQRKSVGAAAGFRDNRPLAAAQRKMCGVIQRAEVTTNYGTFKTTKFNPVATGIDIRLEFDPNGWNFSWFGHCPVRATKIGMIQSVHREDLTGVVRPNNKTTEARTVGSGLPGAGYTIDRLAKYCNPVYGVYDNTVPDLASVQEKGPTYGLGECIPMCCSTEKTNAWLEDKPCGIAHKSFETTALALEGRDTVPKQKYYGSVKWGYKYDGVSVTADDISLVSNGDPSDNFMEPAKLWNAAKADQGLKAKNNIIVNEVQIPKNTVVTRVATIGALTTVRFSIGGTDYDIDINTSDIDTATGRVLKDISCSPKVGIPVAAGTLMSYLRTFNTGALYTVKTVGSPIPFFVDAVDVDLDAATGTPNIPLPIV